MRILGRTKEQRRNDELAWHEWFAWHPVEVEDGVWAWMEWVERQKVFMGLYTHVAYRPIKGAA